MAWAPTDGAASEIHLIELSATPTDATTVPNSTSADYVATWTNDGRIWFTWDESPPSSHRRLYSYGPADKEQSSILVDDAILIRSARALR